jgi:dihydropteroate synthase
MGVVNVTPDSFSDGGETLESAAAVERATSLAAEGAAFIDVGAESTRPGADGISPSEELARLMPVLSGLKDLAVPVSVDTRKPAVMRAAVEAGAAMINDISALAYDATSVETAVALSVPVVLMHAQGEPKTMQDNPAYKDVTIEVYEWLERRIEAVEAAGLPRDRILADPGIGFGKTAAHNLTLLRTLGLFHGLGVPLIVGTYRKNFLGRITGEKTPKGRVSESVTTAIAVAAQGVQVLRVHDVDATNRAFSVWLALHRGVETAI